ncbi:Hypothetical predicted protein [Cloeon dipterum]|uniref:Uncharacterized protein n=1 Tax=Cloeon dipterum TaxID=197152 RepID=A0A8S1DYK7_9INSE|nr:Hypothetical predicted protein [Cloeon dipterum]
MDDSRDNKGESNDQNRPTDESPELGDKEETIPRKEFDPSASLEQKLEFVMSRRANIPAILYAAKFGDFEVCKQLVTRQGEDFNVTDEEGNGAYHYAALNKTFGEQLINKFKDFEEHSFSFTKGSKLLEEEEEIVEEIPYLSKTDNGWEFNAAIFTQAAACTDPDTFRWLMKIASVFDKNLVRTKEWKLEILPFTFFNIKHADKIASILLESLTTDELTSIITYYLSTGTPFLNNDVLGLFHSRGVDLKIVFRHCLSKNFLDTAQYVHDLEPQEIDSTSLYNVARGSGVEMTEWLLELNPALELDERFLHAALKNAKYGRKIIDHFADKLGAHINSVTEEGKAPLHVAVDNKNLHVFETLLNIGADLSVKYKDWNMLIYCLKKMFLRGAKVVYAKDAKQLAGSNEQCALDLAKSNKTIEEWLKSVGYTR